MASSRGWSSKGLGFGVRRLGNVYCIVNILTRTTVTATSAFF